MVTGVLDTLISFVQTVDWQQIGAKIGEFLANIDYGGIASRIFELLGSAIAGTVSLVWGYIKSTAASIGSFFAAEIEACGGNVAEGLFNGIGKAFTGVSQWIVDHIFKPFIDGFKKAFGIHSPSKVMAEMGGYIIDGLYNAISDGVKRIKEIFGRVLSAIHGVFDGIADWFGGVFSGAWEAVTTAFSAVGSWFGARWSDITGVFSGAASWFGDIFAKAWGRVKEAFGGAKSFFTGLWNDIKSTFTDLGTKVGDTVGGALKTVVNGIMATIEDTINKGIGMINGAIKIINKIPGVDIGKISELSLPRLAQGGLATAPTLAMVGDNRNARTDPEVIAPLSKLEGMLGGGNGEIVELLRLIVELLRGGMNIEIINYMFRNSREFSREVIKAVREDAARGGA